MNETTRDAINSNAILLLRLKMRKAASQTYENLVYSEYSKKNETIINALIMSNITSNEARKTLENQMN